MERTALAAALLAAVAACGGGGGGPPPPLLQTLNLGLVRADQPSALTAFVQNPLDKEAVVESVEEPVGDFAFEAGTLPGVVAAGGDFAVRLLFTPQAAGLSAAEFRIRFRGADGRGEQDVIATVSASVEATGIALVTARLDFGDVRIGRTRSLGASVRNPNALTPVRVNSLSVPPPGFTLGAGVLPRTIPPGQTLTFDLTYEPDVLTAHDFDLLVHHSEAAQPLAVRVTAATTTWIPEMITDYGPVPLAGGETDWLTVDVPPHAISLSLEATGPAGAVIGLLGLEGPNGEVYENDTATGSLWWTPGDEVFTSTVPNSDRADVQLVPGGGAYRFRLYLLSGSAASLDVRAIVHNRPDAIVASGVVHLNVFLAPGLNIALPASEARLQQILDRTNDLFLQQGLQLGAVSYFQLADPAYDEVSGSEFEDLLMESAAAPEVRLNVFFVKKTLSGGVLGVAARVPGPKLNGTPVSGVMVDYDFGSAATGGGVTAHELGHYLGLFHTTDSDGSHDFIDDTLECPATGTSAACPTEGNGNLMHWRVTGASFPVLTDGQGRVILGHPLVEEPPPLAGLAQRLPPLLLDPPEPLPPGWCGTPACPCAK